MSHVSNILMFDSLRPLSACVLVFLSSTQQHWVNNLTPLYCLTLLPFVYVQRFKILAFQESRLEIIRIMN